MLKKHLFFIFCLFLLIGCGSPVAEYKFDSLSEAHLEFQSILQEEHKLEADVKVVGETLWIYVPSEKPILELLSSGEDATRSHEPKTSVGILYLNAEFNENFEIAFDIRENTNYGENPGYNEVYSEYYDKTTANIAQALSKTFFNIKPGDNDIPAFVVIVLVDTKNGIVIENSLYLQDLKRFLLTGDLPFEEYLLRSLFKVYGKSTAIDDASGKFVEYKDIMLADHVANLIVKRIDFKYKESAFPPGEDAFAEILKATAQTLYYYNFTDYNSVIITDLKTQTKKTFSSLEVENATEK